MSFIKHSIQTVFVRVLSLLLMFLVGVITARWLGPAGDGILALLILLKNLCFRFGNLGFGSAFAFFLPKNPESVKQFIRWAWGLSAVLVLVCIGILLTIWKKEISPWQDISPTLFYLSLPMVFLFFISNYFQRILSGQLRITEMNVANLLLGASNTVLLGVFVITLDMGLIGGVISFVLSDMIVFVYLLVCVYRQGSLEQGDAETSAQKPPKTLSELWQYGRWNYIAMLTNFLVEELPLILVKLFVRSNTTVGYFNKARVLGRQSRVVALPISKVLFPYTAASEERESVYRTNVLCRNSLVVMAALVTVSTLLIKPIILILYGEDFLPGVQVFYGLAAGVIVWPCSNFLAVHISAMGKSKVVSILGLVTLLLAVMICYPVIRQWGAVGAGWSITAIYAVQMILRLVCYSRLAKTKIRQVILVQRNDAKYYRKLLRAPWSRIEKMRKK